MDTIEEPNYYLKSLKARRVNRRTRTQALTRRFTLSFLVFGIGEGSEGFDSHRVPVKRLIEELDQNAAFPEEIPAASRGGSVEKALQGNTAVREIFLVQEYDYTFIIMMSYGSVSEFSSLLTKPEVAYKIRLYIPTKYRNSPGYLTTGPVKAFNDVHRHVYYFNDPQHLLSRVRRMVLKMIVLRAYQH